MYFIYRGQGQSFQDIGMYGGDSVSVTGLAEPEQVRALLVTDGTLPILGVSPVLGRLFSREDDCPARPKPSCSPTAIGSTSLAPTHQPSGATSWLMEVRQIIGVLPQRFHFLDREDPAMFLPFKFDRNKIFLGNFSYEAVARLKPGSR